MYTKQRPHNRLKLAYGKRRDWCVDMIMTMIQWSGKSSGVRMSGDRCQACCHGTHPHTFIPWHLLFAMSAILPISVILPISTIPAPCTCWPSNQVNDIYPVIVLSYRLHPTSCIQQCSYLYIALPVTTLFSTLHPAYTNSVTYYLYT